MSEDGRQQFIPPLTPITIMRQLGANIRMKDSGDVLEIEDDHGTTHTEQLVREQSGPGLLFERRLETARQFARSAQV